MQVPLEITFRDVQRSEWSENFIREQVQRLERYAPDITSCRVAVEIPQRHQSFGNRFRVRVEVSLPPNRHLVATREPADTDMHAELRTVIRGAFAAVERQVKAAVEKRRNNVKVHDEAAGPPHAFVVRLFPEQYYGFIKTADGREFYFHRNSVLHGDYERLSIGTEVRFEPGMGEKGPQASSLQIVSKPGERASDDEVPHGEVPLDWRQH